MVSERQSGVQLSECRELAGDKTIFKNNSIRQRDDNDPNEGVDTQNFNVANSNSEGLQRTMLYEVEREVWAEGNTRRLDPNWRQYVSKPILPRGSYGLSNRVDRTKALGNSVVPQVAAIPLQRVHDLYYNE